MNVLILDDDRAVTLLLRSLVQELPGCVPLVFNCPMEALEATTSGEWDLVLVDYQMPDLNGIEFVRRLRERDGFQELPVVMITGDLCRETRYQALQVGATDFLTKPVDAVEFLARVRNMLELRRSQKSLQDRAAWLAAEVAKATAEIRAREHEIILRLSRAAEFRDQETGDHTVRVGRYAQLISARLGFSEEDQEILLRAAPMHDIGKVGVPDHVLLKAGPLTSEERAVMEQHTVIGYHILRGSASSLLQRAAEIALSHHEKWDGTGYPNGWAGEKIPILGRIVAVADVFDALSTRRPYRPAWDVERAGSYLQENRGTHFDVRCVEAFLDGWDEMLRIRAEIAEPHGPLAAVRAPLLAAAAGRMAHAS